MGIRSKEDERAFRELARAMYFSNEAIDAFLEEATSAQVRSVADLILREQAIRARNKHSRLMRKAKFPAIKGFADYDFQKVAFPEGYSKEDMLSLRFIERMQDFVFVGPTGRGKTHMAIALGIEAVNAGYEVRFFTVASLVMHMAHLKGEGRIEAFLAELERASLVILDEFGYVPIDIEGARLLYQVMSACHERRSLIITTNIEFGRWGAVLGDDKMAAAIIDRLVHHGRLLEFTGASHRMENALMLGKQKEEDVR